MRRQRRGTPPDYLRPDLFPFISLFLCMIGVLAFLQNLLIVGRPTADRDLIQPRPLFATPYRVALGAGTLRLDPPPPPPRPLLQRLGPVDRLSAAAIQVNRERRRQFDAAGASAVPDEDALRTLLNEIVTLNRLARAAGYPYEEYLLFTIGPGGGDAFHLLRGLLHEPAYRSLRLGAETDATADPWADVRAAPRRAEPRR